MGFRDQQYDWCMKRIEAKEKQSIAKETRGYHSRNQKGND